MQSLLKSLAIAVLLAVVGYVIAPMLFKAPPMVFASGLFVGALAAIAIQSLAAGAPKSEKKGNGELQSVFVGNLSFKARPEELRELFASYGEVHSVRIMSDRQTKRPRGFAFVEMTPADAGRAIKALDGQEFLGRQLRVNEGTERRPRQE